VLKIEKKDTKTLVFALAAIVIIAVVAINLGPTGKAVSKQGITLTKLYVSADPSVINQDSPVVNAGSFVYITVEAGTDVDKEIKIINKKTGLRVTDRTLKGCGGVDCDPGEVGTTKYRTSTSWNGEYCVIAKHRKLDKEWQACFTVQ